MHSQRRRNSVPPPSTLPPGEPLRGITRDLEHYTPDRYFAERWRMSMEDHEDAVSSRPAPTTAPTIAPTTAPTTAPTQMAPTPYGPAPECLICCTSLPQHGDTHVLRPCRLCNNLYCVNCVTNMFIDACKDSTLMPPRCCVPLNIQCAKPYLTKDEADLFRTKYEEWSTADAIYCPVPACSAFISDRLLPQHLRANKKPRLDSGIGTPDSVVTFACPACNADICTGCRQQAHPGSMCGVDEFGLDSDTAKLLKEWGYKKCPKCGHGLKRMYGCNHMKCRCGADFCWKCLESLNDCDGRCYDSGDDDDDYDDDDDESSDRDTAHEENVQNAPSAENATASNDSPEATASEATLTRHTPQPNLDGGGSEYWLSADLDFGAEPQDDGSEPFWTCDHDYLPYRAAFESILTPTSSEMECMQCWCIVRPTMDAPAPRTKSKKNAAPASHHRAATSGVRRNQARGSGRVRGSGRGRAYAPPRGLYRTDATMGTATYLTTSIQSHASTRPISPMEDVQFSTTPALAPTNRSVTSPSKTHTQQSVLDLSAPPAAPAHECQFCYHIVCEACRNAHVAGQEEKEKKRKEEIAREKVEHQEGMERERLGEVEERRVMREEMVGGSVGSMI
ncbi:hypothetical protein ACEQ8H_008194 [Pleosporales sp. CAS-2024a]